MKWPSLSPDLNPVENMWAILVQRVYQNGRQFNTTLELEQAIYAAWDDVSLNTIADLIDSMKNRIFNVIYNRGSHSNY